MAEQIQTELITGGCHCGSIRFEFRRCDPGTPIAVRACGCTLCQKHAAVWTSDPKGSFTLSVEDPQLINRYRFGTKTAEFHICQTCGVVPITIWPAESKRYAVLNVHTFDDVDKKRFIERKTNFDGETTEERLARRKRSWTPEIT